MTTDGWLTQELLDAMLAEDEEPQTWVFTFGPDLIDPRTGKSLGYGWVQVPVDTYPDGHADVDSARRRMLERFGWTRSGAGNWAFDYPTPHEAGVGRFPSMVELDFDTGLPK